MHTPFILRNLAIYTETSMMQRMSAFTKSGHSNALQITDITGRFRPEAALWPSTKNPALGGAFQIIFELDFLLASCQSHSSKAYAKECKGAGFGDRSSVRYDHYPDLRGLLK